MNPLLNFHFGLEGAIAPMLYAGAILAFLLSIFKNPVIGLYVVIPLLPLQTVRYRLHPYPLGHSFIDIMLLGVTLGLIIRGQKLIRKMPLTVVMLATAAYTYVALWKGTANLSLPAPLWFSDVRLADWKNNLLVPTAVFFLVYAAVKTTREMKVLIACICLSTFLFNRSIYSVVGQRTYTSFSYDSRAESGGIGSNGLAAFEVQLGFFLLGLFAYERRRMIRSLYFGLAMFCFYCVMYSFSRGAYAAFLVGWLLWGVLRVRKSLLVLGLFLLLWQALVPNAVRERVLMTYSGDGELESSANARVSLWEDALDVIRVDPIFGIGYLTYGYMHRSDYTDTHNLYVKILVETGVVGLGLFIILIWRLIQIGWRLHRTATTSFHASIGFGLVLWMGCALITNIFGDRWNYIQINGYLWTISALSLRALALEHEQAPDEDEDPSVDTRVLEATA
jgi:O-antigen ligase